MAPFALLSGRRLAQVSELASPPVGNHSPVVSLGPDQSSRRYERETGSLSHTPLSTIFARNMDAPSNEVSPLPSLTSGIVGASCFLAIAILIFGVWKVIQWRRRTRTSRAEGILPSRYPSVEKKLRPLILAPRVPLSPSVRWVPAKLSPWIDPRRIPRKPTPSLSKESISSRSDASSVLDRPILVDQGFKRGSLTEFPDTLPRKPPSTYCLHTEKADDLIATAKSSPVNQELSPVSSASVSQIDTPGTLSEGHTQVSSASVYSDMDSRISCFQENSQPDPDSENHAPPAKSPRSNLHKLAIVKRTFPVSLPDELRITKGEKLRLLQEFKDGWALCERIGKGSEQGVVPRCCLTELTIDTSRVLGKNGEISDLDEADGQG